MALLVERADIVSALSAVARIIESRNTYPILANVLLTVADGRLTVRGTDLDIEITTSIPCTGTIATTTAPAKTLLEIVKKFPAGAEVSLELERETLTVKSGKSRFKLAVLSADSFPSLASGEFGEPFEADLATLFAPIAFAISDDASRYMLNGIYLAGDGKKLTAVATDGHRLAKHTLELGAEFKAIIVPAKTVSVVPPGAIAVSVSDTKVRFQRGETVIVSKLIEAVFPDFERVIPKNNDRIITVDRSTLLAAVDRVGTVASDRGGKVVKLEVAADTITLTVQGDLDSADDEVATDYDGQPVESGMNTRYLQDILGAISGATVTLAFSDTLGPILLRGDNDNWVGVQMPMRA